MNDRTSSIASPRSDARAALGILGPWGISAGAAAVLALVVCLSRIGPIVRAVLVPRTTATEEQAKDQQRAARYGASFDGYLAQVRGRSMFFLPPEPPPEPGEARASTEASAPTPPARYAGPGIIAMVNGAVWFDDGRHLEIGVGEGAALRVVAINAPWSARIEWNGVEFEVPLFERTTPRFLAPPEPEPTEPPEDPVAQKE